MSSTVYLVTGATRGIGFNLVQSLSSRPNVIVFGGTRSFPLKDDDQLAQLAAKYPDVVIPIKLTSADEEDNAAAAKQIKEQVGKVDVVIANAGIGGLASVLTSSVADFRRYLHVNTIGPLVLFQAFHSLLLLASDKHKAKFVVISSRAGQIGEMVPFQVGTYGASKAAVNYIVKKIDQENPEIASFPIHPGTVDTDPLRETAAAFGTTPEAMGAISGVESVEGILAVMDKATKSTHGGKFWDYTGEELTF